MRLRLTAALLFAFFVWNAASLHAQAAPSSSPAPAADAASTSDRKAPASGGQELDERRILGIVPNFISTEDTAANSIPLTVGEKFKLSAEQSLDISAHLGNLLKASVHQAKDGRPHYGQGWGPFGERFGAAEGNKISSSFFIVGALPALFKEDPRYFRRGAGSWDSRAMYGISRTFVIRSDSGGNTFNISQVLGQLLSASVQNIYYPRQDRGYGPTFKAWGLGLSYNCAYNVLREFYPDMLHAIFPRHNPKASRQPATPGAVAPASSQ